MEDMLRVGVITSTHGIRGEVKVFPTTDDPLRFKKLKKCVIDGKREQVAVTVSSVKFFKQFVILDRKSTRLNSSHTAESRMPSSA